MRIKSLKAIEILDSRGKPTVKTFVTLDNDSTHCASVPSGASTGSHEAVELRDNDPQRFLGFGVSKAVNNVNNIIAPKLIGLKLDELEELDELIISLDGTENKSKLGANAILSVSMALQRAAAYSQKKPLWQFLNAYYFSQQVQSCTCPRLMVNIVNGGKHASWNFDIQEFMISPKSNKPSEAVRIASEIFLQLGKNLKEKKLATLVGDEGGYSPSLESNEQVLETIIEAAKVVGHQLGVNFDLALDSAATEFYKDNSYVFKKTNQQLTGDELIKYYLSLQEKYQIISFEDPFAEDDWESFKRFTEKTNSIIVGDDLYVTNPKRIQKGIEEKATNAVLIKPNQIGTILETVEAIKLAKNNNLKVVISHRSGETEDSFIADLAYGCSADFIKTGSMSRSERLTKYNRLIEIENGL